MTIDELRQACIDARRNRADVGLDPEDAHLILVVPGRMGRTRRKRVLPGLMGDAVGETEVGTVIVDCTVIDVERWLERHGSGT